MLTDLYRGVLLGVVSLPPVASFVKRQGWHLGVKRFVAGEDFKSGLATLQSLESQGLHVILDSLGEFVGTEAEANAITDNILAMLEMLVAADIKERYVSIKPTQFGLAVGKDIATKNAHRLAKYGLEHNIRICLDMESSEYVDGTLELFKTLHAEGFSNVSMVLQAYLHRSLDDLKMLSELSPKPFIRLVKGAYKEPAEIAYQSKAQVDELYRRMIFDSLQAGVPIGLGTHDENVIAEVKAYLLGAENPPRVEFQMLYGVKPNLQLSLKNAGYATYVYMPYGKDWYGYFSRRIAERPANLLFVLRGIFS